jgi:hypothetical protein
MVLLDDDFESSIARAHLEIFLLLADALNPSLVDLFLADRDGWNKIIEILAKTVVDQLPHMDAVSDVGKIWNQFMNVAQISKQLQAKPKAILQRVGVRLRALGRTRNHSLKYIGRANDEAIAWIKALGGQVQISRLAKAQQVPVRVYYDPEAVEYCASSNVLVGEIGWKLQIKEYAFFGALIPDMLIEHEYISHMLPNNHSLSKGVREIWLTEALFRVHRNSPIDPNLKAVKRFLWLKFRADLAKHFHFLGGEREVYGRQEIDGTAKNSFFHDPDAFWSLTQAILEIADSEDDAAIVDSLLETLAGLDDTRLKEALRAQWKDLPEFLRIAMAIK